MFSSASGARRAVSALLTHLGLRGVACRARDRSIAWRALRRDQLRPGPDGLPLPPPELMTQVQGDADVAGFLEGSAEGERLLREALAAAGTSMEEVGAFLDFGCGCGRIARCWSSVGASGHGCDYNPSLIAWCQQHLSHMRFVTNAAHPPLRYEANRFGLVYAFSVLTHFTETQHHEWMVEWRRVLQPGGLLIFSTHGDAYAGEMEPELRARYERGELIVRDADMAGRNHCSAFQPHAWVVASLLDGFDLESFVPAGATANGEQDLYVVRRQAVADAPVGS